MKSVLARMRMLAFQIYEALSRSGVNLGPQSEDIIFKALREFFKV